MTKIFIELLLIGIIGIQYCCTLPVERDALAVSSEAFTYTNNANETISISPEKLEADIKQSMEKAKLLLNNVLKDDEILKVHSDIMANYTKNLTAIVDQMDNLKCENVSVEECAIIPVFVEFLYAMESINTTNVTHPSAEQVLLESTLEKYGIQDLWRDIGETVANFFLLMFNKIFDEILLQLKNKFKSALN